MILKGVGIILLDNNRGKAYIQNLVKNNLYPAFAIVLAQKNSAKKVSSSKYSKDFFDASEPVVHTLNKSGIKYKKIDSEDCNDKAVISELKSRAEKYFIYTGGGILSEKILGVGKKFIHIHPGIVPDYRGSTCFYYSIINEGKVGATAFFMEKSIDTGNVIAQKRYKKPDIADIDNIYDPYIRSDLLVDVMKDYIKKGKLKSKKQDNKPGETYYIIHPVLKHLAILMCRQKKS